MRLKFRIFRLPAIAETLAVAGLFVLICASLGLAVFNVKRRPAPAAAAAVAAKLPPAPLPPRPVDPVLPMRTEPVVVAAGAVAAPEPAPAPAPAPAPPPTPAPAPVAREGANCRVLSAYLAADTRNFQRYYREEYLAGDREVIREMIAAGLMIPLSPGTRVTLGPLQNGLATAVLGDGRSGWARVKDLRCDSAR